MIKINKAEFLTGAADAKSIPKPGLSEIAFAGKSNVGKSSLINKLLNRKKLAITSSKPGRTRQINFFNVNDEMIAVDLPGYGYAKVSQMERREWGKLITAYMMKRDPLKAVVAILDVRRDPDELDKSLLKMLNNLSIPPIIVLTKSDKIKTGEKIRRRMEIAKSLGVEKSDLILFSAQTGEGKDELWKAIKNHLQ